MSRKKEALAGVAAMSVTHAAFAAAWSTVMSMLEDDAGDSEARSAMRDIERLLIQVEHHLRKASR